LTIFFQAMLKKHEAIMSDLEAYGTVIDGLREQSKECKVGSLVSV
jgi:spectrin alpha